MPETDTEPEGSLTILLVEDNPGDARYIQEMFRDAEELSERATDGGREATDGQTVGAPPSEPTLVHETRLSGALDRLDDEHADVVLLDLNLPDSEGLETVEAVREHTDAVPIVVLTGIRDRELGLEAIRRGAEEYLVKNEINADLLSRSVHHAIERRAHERELERQRNRLATLNSLNELVDDVSHLAIEASTRDEVERLVCERLADSEPYVLAWIGDVDRDHETVTVRTGAGAEGYLDEVTVRIDGDDGRHPTGRAVRTGEVHVAQDVSGDPDGESWRDQAREYGIRSSAAIPIEYEGTLYGVLAVHSERPDAFEDEERAVVGRLGKVIGHAINAIERKQALMSEEVVELRFRIRNVFDGYGVSDSTTGRIAFDRTIPLDGEEFLQYGTVARDGRDTLRVLVEAVPHYRDVTVFDDADESRFELRLSEPPVISTIAAHGGRIERFALEDGNLGITVHLPPDADVHRVVDAVEAEYTGAETTAVRQMTRTDQPSRRLERVTSQELTEKQRAAIEAAYFAGFFEWPRESSGEDVAESLGVSASTFHQHVRVGERKLLRSLLDDDTGV